MPPGQLRISVIGAQTAEPESPKPYTVYRTVVTYDGECYERLLRYSQFYWFYNKLKLQNGSVMRAQFPGKTWTRKATLDDDLIEARQVMLNEFMKELCSKELTSRSENYLMKFLRIGKYEDSNGGRRVSEMSSYKASFIQNERPTLKEADDDTKEKENRRHAATSFELGASATLATTSIEFPANITSNATTVLADDERSAIGSRPRLISDEEDHLTLSARSASSGLPPRPPAPASKTNGQPTSRASLNKATSIPPSPYSDLVLQRPVLKTSQSLPGRRSRHVGFPGENSAPASAPADLLSEDPLSVDGDESPEKKYRDRVNSQLSTISRLLSGSDVDTDMSSTRSTYDSPVALTA